MTLYRQIDRESIASDPGTWPRYRKKTATTPMVEIRGPVEVWTQEGPYVLRKGWVGMLAVDTEGYPYPVSRENFEASYDPEPVEDE